MADEKIARKIAQAEFHLDKLRAAEEDFDIESYFAAFLACVRSATMYAHEWQLANALATRKGDWARINAWEGRLPPADYTLWRAAVDLRNLDIHEEPVVVHETWGGGFFGGYFGSYFGNYFGDSAAHTVPHPDTGNRTKVLDVAEAALRVVKQLATDYKTM